MTSLFAIRPITAADDAAVARIIRTVMPDFGASGPGFAIHDAEVSAMHSAYARERSAYFVLEQDGEVVGGAGIAPLASADPSICELRKMYFLPAARGHGQGRAMIERCLAFAREAHFRTCYLETLTGMDAAQKLYARMGFERRQKPIGDTGHFSCDRFFTLAL